MSSQVSAVALVIALVLAVVAIVVLFGLLWLILSPIKRALVEHKGRGRLKSAMSLLSAVDELMARKENVEALKLLRQSIVLETISEENLINLFRDHHENILSRLVLISEEMGSRPEHLAEVEELFIERTELMGLYARAQDSYKSLSSRRAKEGKSLPSWSKADFEKRIVQIQEELRLNQKTLQTALDQLFRAVSSAGGEPIVYH